MNFNPASAETKTREALGIFFRYQRMKSGVSLAETERWMRMPTSAIEHFEAGRTPLPLEDILSLSNYYNLDPDLVVKLVSAAGIADACLFEDCDYTDE